MAGNVERVLLGVVQDIEADARGARRKFQRHSVVNGRTTLRRIEERCQDALAEVHEPLEQWAPPR